MFSLRDAMMSEIKTKRIRSLGSVKKTLWPSQAAVLTDTVCLGKCVRSSFYEKTGVEETDPVSDAVSIMGYMGMMIEDGLIDMMKNKGLWEANNVKWNNDLVSGEVDVIIRAKEMDDDKSVPVERKYIVECKSCSGYFSNKEVYGYTSGREPNKKWNPGQPKIKHLLQAAIYADISRGTCDGVILLYVSRDEAKLQEFRIRVEDTGTILVDGVPEVRFSMSDVYETYRKIRTCIESSTLPKAMYKFEYTNEEVDALLRRGEISAAAHKAHISGEKPYQDKDCAYCNYKTRCMRDGVNQKLNYLAPSAESQQARNQQKETDDLDWFFKSETVKAVNTDDKPLYLSSGSF